MDSMLGLLKIRVKRGIKLAVRDLTTSDPYVVISMAQQTRKTRVIKKNCNPHWDEELTLSITDLNLPINVTVFDRDTFSGDDKMGEAEIDIKPLIESLRMGLKNLPTGCVISRVQPSRANCLSDESRIVWRNGSIVQDMLLRLRNVESGEIEIQIEWVDVPGCKGLSSDNASQIRVKRID